MAATTLLRVFDEHWTAWRRGVEAGRDGLGRAAVHDLRVTTRRVLSLLELVRELAPGPRRAADRVTRALEELIDALGPLRDAQNQRNRVAHTRGGTGVEPLRRHLERREARLTKRARRVLEKIDSPKVEKAVGRLRAAVAAPGPTRAARRLLLARAVDLIAADVRHRLARLDPDRPRTAHRLRIALKRFRYATEISVRLAPAVDAGGQATVLSLQRRLGRAHDAEVLQERLERFTRRHPGRGGAGIEALHHRLDAERARQLKGLMRALTPLRRTLTGVAARAAVRPASSPGSNR